MKNCKEILDKSSKDCLKYSGTENYYYCESDANSLYRKCLRDSTKPIEIRNPFKR